MCRNSYKKILERTGKEMLFCKLRGNDGSLKQLCISQRFCQEKDKYIESDHPNKMCKNYEK